MSNLDEIFQTVFICLGVIGAFVGLFRQKKVDHRFKNAGETEKKNRRWNKWLLASLLFLFLIVKPKSVESNPPMIYVFALFYIGGLICTDVRYFISSKLLGTLFSILGFLVLLVMGFLMLCIRLQFE